MKSLLPPCLLLFVLISGCKKNDAPPPDHLAQLKAGVIGNWYYNSLEVTFYKDQQVVLDEVVTPDYLRNEPYFVFNKDLTGSYIDSATNQKASFAYAVTSTNGADSLICSGGVNQRFSVQFLGNSQMNISAAFKDNEEVQKYGNTINTDFTKIVAVLDRSPIK